MTLERRQLPEFCLPAARVAAHHRGLDVDGVGLTIDYDAGGNMVLHHGQRSEQIMAAENFETDVWKSTLNQNLYTACEQMAADQGIDVEWYRRRQKSGWHLTTKAGQ